MTTPPVNLRKDGTRKSKDLTISSVERLWLLYILDAIAINGGFLLSLQFREEYKLSWDLIVNNPEWFILLNGLWFFLGYLLQVYDIERAGQYRTALLPSLSTGLLVTVLFNFIPYIPPTLPPSRQPLFVAIFLPPLFLILGRLIYLTIFAQARFRRKLIIIGAGWAGRTIYQALIEHAQTLYEVVGFIDDDPQISGSKVEIRFGDPGHGIEEVISANVLGTSKVLFDNIDKYGVSTVVIAITQDISGELYQVLTDCLQRQVEVIPMPLLYEHLTGKVPVEHIGAHWSISMPIEQPGTRFAWHALKRIFDLFWSFLGLIFLTIFFPLIAVAIKLDSKGPLFYTQERMGRNEKIFRVYKFRSMIINAETDNAVWAQKNDPRVTRLGKILRKTHIDEFPQFWNIFKGDMSVVGPRPERPEFIKGLAEDIPFYRVRLAVKPGMAGWGLINQGYGASKKDTLEKLQYDLYYIKHQSFWLDMQILWRTVMDALALRGR